ncbi:MAG TPA: HAD family hydrolase [Euryarchaeota archaeon]|nr:HAD family hydrolase [Euryarchaeota archaeon]
MIKVILFDVSGTLIDPESSERAHKLIISKILETYDESIISEVFEKFNTKVSEIFNKMSSEGSYLEYYRICYRALKDVLGSRMRLDEKEYKRMYIETLSDVEMLFPGVKEALKYLKERGYTLGVITDGDRDYTETLLERKGIKHFFDVIVSAEDVRKYKPSKEPFLKALKVLDINPEQALYIGDNPVKDKRGPELLGIRAYIVENGVTKDKIIKILGEEHE